MRCHGKAVQAKVIAIALAVAACQWRGSGEEQRTAAVATADVSVLSAEEFARLKRGAEQGDPEAAYRIALHYDADPRTGLQQEPWLRQAAAAKHAGAIQQLAVFLYVRGDKAGCEEAVRFVMLLDESVTDRKQRDLLGVDRMVRSAPESRASCRLHAK
jgi:hypothetical protein